MDTVSCAIVVVSDHAFDYINYIKQEKFIVDDVFFYLIYMFTSGLTHIAMPMFFLYIGISSVQGLERLYINNSALFIQIKEQKRLYSFPISCLEYYLDVCIYHCGIIIANKYFV